MLSKNFLTFLLISTKRFTQVYPNQLKPRQRQDKPKRPSSTATESGTVKIYIKLKLYIGTNCPGAKRLKLIKNQNFYLGPGKTILIEKTRTKLTKRHPLDNFTDYNGGQF